jgi:hypothetical protein
MTCAKAKAIWERGFGGLEEDISSGAFLNERRGGWEGGRKEEREGFCWVVLIQF